jgi:hypothetical protein
MMSGTVPDQHFIDLIDRAAYLRGRYLTSYAQCEFLLADLSVRVDSRFRYALDKRINAAKVMATGSGPLNAYADDFLPLIENVGAWSDRRHWFAHGFQIMYTDPEGRHSFELRRYEQEEDGRFALLQWFATVEEMQNSVDAINRYATAFVALCHRIYLDLGLEGEPEPDHPATLPTLTRK